MNWTIKHLYYANFSIKKNGGKKKERMGNKNICIYLFFIIENKLVDEMMELGRKPPFGKTIIIFIASGKNYH